VQLLIAIHYLLERSVHPPKAPEISRKAKADLTTLQVVARECVMSHMRLRLRWMSHGTPHDTLQYDSLISECVTSHMWLRRVRDEWVTAHMYGWITSHMNRSSINGSWPTNVRISLHYRLSHVNVSCRTCDCVCVLSHMWLRQRWMSHGTPHNTLQYDSFRD